MVTTPKAGDEGLSGLLRLEGAASPLDPEAARGFAGSRLLLCAPNPTVGDALATAFRSLGAAIGLTDARGTGLERLGWLDPHAVLIDAADAGAPALRERLDAHPRLGWARTIRVPWATLWPRFQGRPDLMPLVPAVAQATAPDRSLRARALDDVVRASIAPLGPARVLRALAGSSEQVLELFVERAHARALVELCGELVVGARYRAEGRTETGSRGLAAFLLLREGVVEGGHRELARAITVMAPVDVALDEASEVLPEVRRALEALPGERAALAHPLAPEEDTTLVFAASELPDLDAPATEPDVELPERETPELGDAALSFGDPDDWDQDETRVVESEEMARLTESMSDEMDVPVFVAADSLAETTPSVPAAPTDPEALRELAYRHAAGRIAALEPPPPPDDAADELASEPTRNEPAIPEPPPAALETMEPLVASSPFGMT
ncbi:MAG: hypothetical protein AAGH15_28340, partial [Myxococcota bacterium]